MKSWIGNKAVTDAKTIQSKRSGANNKGGIQGVIQVILVCFVIFCWKHPGRKSNTCSSMTKQFSVISCSLAKNRLMAVAKCQKSLQTATFSPGFFNRRTVYVSQIYWVSVQYLRGSVELLAELIRCYCPKGPGARYRCRSLRSFH